VALKKIVFDTSALNELARGGKESDALFAALGCGFDVWLPGIAIGELVATQEDDVRERLLACSQRLLRSGRCVYPQGEVLRRLGRNGIEFDWRKVDIRAQDYELGIINRDVPRQLPKEELREQQALNQEYMGVWRDLRSKLAPAFENANRPTSYREAVQIARSGSPSLIVGIGQQLYEKAVETRPSEVETETFLAACPPFRAVCYACCGSWYDLALSPRVAAERRLPGRNDHFMAIYLPYCDLFITCDRKQRERLADIAVEAGLDCEVTLYEQFCDGFLALSSP
jgi:hypothetical protein